MAIGFNAAQALDLFDLTPEPPPGAPSPKKAPAARDHTFDGVFPYEEPEPPTFMGPEPASTREEDSDAPSVPYYRGAPDPLFMEIPALTPTPSPLPDQMDETSGESFKNEGSSP